jgi:hypothetical protein
MSFVNAQCQIDESFHAIIEKHKIPATQALMILGDLMHVYLTKLNNERDRDPTLAADSDLPATGTGPVGAGVQNQAPSPHRASEQLHAGVQSRQPGSQPPKTATASSGY